MDQHLSMNTLRIVLVGLTALGAFIAAILGNFRVAGVLTLAVLVHGAGWWHLKQKRDASHDALHAGVEELLREES